MNKTKKQLLSKACRIAMPTAVIVLLIAVYLVAFPTIVFGGAGPSEGGNVEATISNVRMIGLYFLVASAIYLITSFMLTNRINDETADNRIVIAELLLSILNCRIITSILIIIALLNKDDNTTHTNYI